VYRGSVSREKVVCAGYLRQCLRDSFRSRVQLHGTRNRLKARMIDCGITAKRSSHAPRHAGRIKAVPLGPRILAVFVFAASAFVFAFAFAHLDPLIDATSQPLLSTAPPFQHRRSPRPNVRNRPRIYDRYALLTYMLRQTGSGRAAASLFGASACGSVSSGAQFHAPVRSYAVREFR
jgi:hypothetical protein